MALYENETKTTKNPLQELQTVRTVTKIPVISLGFTKAKDGYEKVKNSNSFLRWYLSTTEATANTVARATLPVIERPLKLVDNLTSKGIDALVKKVPSMQSPPDQITSNASSYIYHKAAFVGRYGLKTSNSVLENSVGWYLLGKLDKAADSADGAIAQYLPKPVDEPATEAYLPEENNGLAKSINKVTGVFATAGKRFMRKKRSVTYINSLMVYTKAKIDKLKEDVVKVRRKSIEEESHTINIRSLAYEIQRIANAGAFIEAGLTADQQRSLGYVGDNIRTIAYILELTPKMKCLSEETVKDLFIKLDYVQNTLTEIFSAASENWFKIPDDEIYALKAEMDLMK